jgi:diguanylate cyclase (GGDEF)-like protein/PAS domain S-box-containing protein
MSDPEPSPTHNESDLQAEIVRLNKIVQALVDRAERGASVAASDFNLFQTAVMLEEQVRDRTAELEAALRENEKTNRALRDSENKFHSIASQSMVGIGIIEDGKFSYVNPRLAEMFGYGAEEGLTLDPLGVVVDGDRPLVAEGMRRRLSGEEERGHYVFGGLRRDGSVIDVEIFSTRMEIGGKPAVLSMMMDITERIRIENVLRNLQDKLRDESIHDPLTGLYNRRYFEEAFQRELTLSQREGHPVSVIMGDLDHFKETNDRHGHLAGDEVLRVFAELMRRHARGTDLCCRYGGEEFLLVLPRMASANAVARAEELRSAIASTRVVANDVPIEVTASFGVATLPRDGRTRDQLLAAADAAMYAAKAAGRNRVNVSPGLAEQ